MAQNNLKTPQNWLGDLENKIDEIAERRKKALLDEWTPRIIKLCQSPPDHWTADYAECLLDMPPVVRQLVKMDEQSLAEDDKPLKAWLRGLDGCPGGQGREFRVWYKNNLDRVNFRVSFDGGFIRDTR